MPMRPLVLKMQMSLDGFVGGPKGEAGWIFKTIDELAVAWIVETIGKASLHIMGSRTFKDMAAWWPQSREPFAPPMNNIPKGVFTRSGLDRATATQALADAASARGEDDAVPSPAVRESWANPLVLHDIERDIPRLKQQDGGPIIAHGGASFAQSLVASGLIDEYQLMVHPVALGAGLPLFSQLAKPLDLMLVSATAFPGGTVAKIYRPA